MSAAARDNNVVNLLILLYVMLGLVSAWLIAERRRRRAERARRARWERLRARYAPTSEEVA